MLLLLLLLWYNATNFFLLQHSDFYQQLDPRLYFGPVWDLYLLMVLSMMLGIIAIQLLRRQSIVSHHNSTCAQLILCSTIILVNKLEKLLQRICLAFAFSVIGPCFTDVSIIGITVTSVGLTCFNVIGLCDLTHWWRVHVFVYTCALFCMNDSLCIQKYCIQKYCI